MSGGMDEYELYIEVCIERGKLHGYNAKWLLKDAMWKTHLIDVIFKEDNWYEYWKKRKMQILRDEKIQSII